MSDEKTTNIAPELPPFDAGYRIGRQDGALYGLSAGSDAPDMITRRGEYYRASLAPPEPLPEDVEALAAALDGVPLRAVARLVLADRQRAVDVEREACAQIALRHISKIAINEPLWHEGQDWAAQRICDAIRARAAAKEGE